jgi:predicted Zn-dependent peptidase
VIEHWARWYRPDRVVVAAAGAIDHDTVIRHTSRWWEADPPHPVPLDERALAGARMPAPVDPGAIAIRHRRLGQGNLCLGMPGVSRDDPDRWALEMLGAVLGDGMSSRLFLELRERRSLAYDVSTFSATYSDAGTFGVHAGFDPDQAEQVVAAILDELERICSEPVGPVELDRARAYTRGRLQLRMEDSAAVASWLGAGESLLPRILTVDEVLEQFDALTADDLLRVAQRLIRPQLARLSALGPFRSRRRFERMLRT